MFLFKRRAVEATAEFKPCAAMNGFQGAKAIFERAHVGTFPSTKIESGLGVIGDDVGAGAAGDDVGVDGYASAKIVPLFDAGDLGGEFMDRIDAFFGSETRVGSAAVDDEFGLAHTFAGGFQQAAGAERRLQDEDRVAALRLCLNNFPGRLAANFLVGGPQKDQALADFRARFAKRFEGEEGLHDAGLHIEGARAKGFAARDAEGHRGERAAGVDGVVMAEDEKLRFGARVRGSPQDAEMIAAVALLDDLDDGAVAQPLFRQEFAAAVGGLFFEAGRFQQSKFPQRFHHLREALAKGRKKGNGSHGSGMVAREAQTAGQPAAWAGRWGQNVRLS